MTKLVSSHPSQTDARIDPRVDAVLAAAERERQDQLDALPAFDGGDLVAEAHRASVARILAEIRSAQARVAAGTYGECTRCSARIPAERLELRPWTDLCVQCAAR